MSVERDIIWLGCENGQHDMRFSGGANACCCPDCSCSIPVHECGNCGGCDYGDNEEAREVRRSCRQLLRSNDAAVAA